MKRKCDFCEQEKEVTVCESHRIEGEYEMVLKSYICQDCVNLPSKIIWPKIQEKWQIKDKEKE